MTEQEFADALVTRLKVRKKTAEGDVYVLDLRHRRFGNRTPRIVRCPDDAGWPFKGRPTSNLEVAKAWVRDKYATLLFKELQSTSVVTNAEKRTFEQAAEDYIKHKMKLLGKEGLRTINSRISMLRVHVIPAIGKLPLKGLTRQIVREKAQALKVTKVVAPGKRKKGKAELGTQKNFVAATSAVWKHTFPDDPCPFAGVRLADEQGKVDRRKALAEGSFETLLSSKSGAMRPSEFLHALTAALYYDNEVGGRRNLKSSMIANTVYAMVIQTALGLRISELRTLRWWHVNFEQRYVIVAGTKTLSAFRIVPLQEQLVPWLLELKAKQAQEPNRNAFVVRTNAKAGQHTPAAVNTLIARFSRALKYAGLKRPKKATHWARATHATWGSLSREIKLEELKAYLGHATPYGGATDAYIDMIVEMMPDAHRQYIRHLPTPDDVRAALATFKPAELPHWKERRKVQSRSKSAKEAQRARGQARKPMYHKLNPDAVTEPVNPVAVAFGFAAAD